MATPMRITAGFTQAAPFQPLAAIGTPDPFFYAQYDDDFLHYNAGDYTVTATGGSVAATAANGSGGRILMTTGATATNFASIQLDAASFAITLGKRMAYLARIRLADITNTVVIAGLCATTVTPFTAITDGIFFSKAAGSTDIILTVNSGSATIGSATISGALTAATDIDLGFSLDINGDIKIFYGAGLEGNKRQNVAVLGPNAGILYSALTAAYPTALLNPTLAVQANTAVAQTMVADFQYAAMER